LVLAFWTPLRRRSPRRDAGSSLGSHRFTSQPNGRDQCAAIHLRRKLFLSRGTCHH
jgi:hypothetical protein